MSQIDANLQQYSAQVAPKKVPGRPFVKGDPRCWRKGRPKSFDDARALAQSIAHESLTLPDGRKITVAEAVLRQWAKSKEPVLQKAFIEYCFGKVPDKIESTLEHKTKLYLNYAHEDRPARNGCQRVPSTVSSGTN